MNLQERQTRNRWKKRTFDCELNVYFQTAPTWLKDSICQTWKHGI